MGDELEDILGDALGCQVGVLAENRQPGFDVGWLNIGEESPLEAATQAILERREIARVPVAADHHLLAGFVEIVEGVEELLEDLLLAFEELHVVQQQDVGGPVAGLEFIHALAADAVDEVVEEILRRDVANQPRLSELQRVVTYCVKQVRLAQPSPAVDEQRVVMGAGLLGHGHRRGVGKTV